MSNVMKCQMSWNVKCHKMSNVKCNEMSNVVIFFILDSSQSPNRWQMLVAYWLGAREVINMHNLSGLRGTPFLVGPDLLAACPSSWCWFLSSATGGPHCRGGRLMGCPSRARTARTSACSPAPWVQARASRADVHHPLSDLLEHGYTERLLVMMNKSQLEEMMEVLLQWSSGHSVVGCSSACLGLGLKTGLVHYYISGLNIMFNASYEESLWRMFWLLLHSWNEAFWKPMGLTM